MKGYEVGDTIHNKRYGGLMKIESYNYDYTLNVQCIKTLESSFIELGDLETDYESIHERRKRIIKEILKE